MKTRSLGVALALAVLVPAVAAQTETITFKKQRPQVGETRTDRGNMSMKISIEVSMGGQVLQSMDQSQDEVEAMRTTVLAKDGDEITEVELHCIDKSSTQKGPAGEMKDESPLVGHTVVAKKKDGEIEITDASGEPVEEAIEEAAIEEAESTFRSREGNFAKIVPDRGIEIGEKLEVDAELARALFIEDEDNPLQDITMVLTLKGRKEHAGQDCGVFDVELTMKGAPNESATVKATLTGELLLGVETCRPLQLSLEGNFEMRGSQSQGGQEITFSGKGPMKIERSATYEQAK